MMTYTSSLDNFFQKPAAGRFLKEVVFPCAPPQAGTAARLNRWS